MEFIDLIKEFIKPELIILIPVLYILGLCVKKSKLPDEIIPFLLGLVSILLCGLYIFATGDINNMKEISMALFTAVTQGVLIGGASVYCNQLLKQYKKK